MKQTIFTSFLLTRLAPAAANSLHRAFVDYCAGGDLETQTKADGSPASRADRDTEALLRNLITSAYPAHGIIGEEMGTINASAEWVWVLDPLDSTRAFLAQESGWCSSACLR